MLNRKTYFTSKNQNNYQCPWTFVVFREYPLQIILKQLSIFLSLIYYFVYSVECQFDEQLQSLTNTNKIQLSDPTSSASNSLSSTSANNHKTYEKNFIKLNKNNLIYQIAIFIYTIFLILTIVYFVTIIRRQEKVQ
jgi:hypothetical protein